MQYWEMTLNGQIFGSIDVIFKAKFQSSRIHRAQITSDN